MARFDAVIVALLLLLCGSKLVTATAVASSSEEGASAEPSATTPPTTTEHPPPPATPRRNRLRQRRRLASTPAPQTTTTTAAPESSHTGSPTTSSDTNSTSSTYYYTAWDGSGSSGNETGTSSAYPASSFIGEVDDSEKEGKGGKSGKDDDAGGQSSPSNTLVIVVTILGGFVSACVLGVAFCWYLRNNVPGSGGGSKENKRRSPQRGVGTSGATDTDGDGGSRGAGQTPRQRSFRRAFMPLSASSSSWATVEDGGEDGSVEQDIHRTNPLFNLPREGRERAGAPRRAGGGGGGGGGGRIPSGIGGGKAGSWKGAELTGLAEESEEEEKKVEEGGGGDGSRGVGPETNPAAAPERSKTRDSTSTSTSTSTSKSGTRHRHRHVRASSLTTPAPSATASAHHKKHHRRSSSSSSGRRRSDPAPGTPRRPRSRGRSIDSARPSALSWEPSRSVSMPSTSSPTTPCLLLAVGSEFLKAGGATAAPGDSGGGGKRSLRRRSGIPAYPPSPVGGAGKVPGRGRSASYRKTVSSESSRPGIISPRGTGGGGARRPASLPPSWGSSHLDGASPPELTGAHLSPHQRQIARGRHFPQEETEEDEETPTSESNPERSGSSSHQSTGPPTPRWADRGRGHRRNSSGGSLERKSSASTGRASSRSPLYRRSHHHRVRPSSHSPPRGNHPGTPTRSGGEWYWGEHAIEQQLQLQQQQQRRRRRRRQHSFGSLGTPRSSTSSSSFLSKPPPSPPQGVALWAAAEALALSSVFAVVRDAANSVANLVKAAGDGGVEGGGGGGGGGGGIVNEAKYGGECWVAWCRSAVQTLWRAVDVLRKATAHDGQAERVLMEDVQESICEMGEIMQSYESRGFSAAEVSKSGLCDRRQGETEEAIASASQRLQLIERVRAGYSLPAGDDGLQNRQRSSQEILAQSKWRRRQQRLDQVEIQPTEVDMMHGDEIIGNGSGSTYSRGGGICTAVYLANCNGLNAAVKVFSLKGGPPASSSSEPEHATNGGRQSQQQENHRRQGSGSGFRNCGGAAAAAAEACLRAHREALTREVESLKRLRDPHIVTVYGVVAGGHAGSDCGGDGRLLMAMELMPGGSLRQRLERSVAPKPATVIAAVRAAAGMAQAATAPRLLPLDVRALRGILNDVCSGMAHLARLGFVHGGLSSSNVLLDAKGRAKISDLGSLLRTPSSHNATSSHASASAAAAAAPPEAGDKRPPRTIGTRLRYTAPEVLAGGHTATSIESDAYSFGMVVLECLTRELPWKGVLSDADGPGALVQAVTAGERPPVPENVPRDLAALARACWAQEPSSRPTLEVVLADFQSAGGVFKDGGSGNVKTLGVAADGRAVDRARPRASTATTTGFPPMPSTPRRRSARSMPPRRSPGTPSGQRTASPDTVLSSGEAPRTARVPPASPPSDAADAAAAGKDGGIGTRGCAGGDGTKEPRGVLSLIEHLQRARGDTIGRLSSGELSPCSPSPPEMGALSSKR